MLRGQKFGDRTGPMRIAFLLDKVDSLTGGAEKFAVALALAMVGDSCTVAFCATRHLDPGVQRRLERAGVSCLVLGRSRPWHFYRFAILWRFLRREKIDVLHSHMFGSNAWGSVVGRLAGTPVVVAHEHTWSYEGRPLRRFVDGFIIGRLVSRFIAVSETDARKMHTVEHVPQKKIVVFPTAFIPDSPADQIDLRSEVGIPASSRIVGTAAMLRPQKALDRLIQAMVPILASFEDVHLCIVGDGECRQQLESLSEDLGLESRIHFLGSRTGITGIIRQFDICALSSSFEGMPLFVLEALSLGIPLVSTNVGAISDLVVDQHSGLLVEPGDPSSLSRAIERVLTGTEFSQQLAQNGLATVSQYSIESVSEMFLKLYVDLLSKH